VRTVGVEEELLLIDEHTGIAVPAAPLVLASGRAQNLGSRVVAEFHQEMLEVQSWPRLLMADLLDDVIAGRAAADALASEFGARAVALAMSPLPFSPHPTKNPRHEAIVERYGHVGRTTLACGLHVHVSIESREEGVAVLDRIRAWLPILLALSANSPFANGVDTGFASYRFNAWHQWQSAGPAEVFGSVEAYDDFERELLATDVLLDAGMLYLDARLSHKYPTIEVRVADVCLDARDSVLIAALVRALADTASAEWRAGIPPARTSAAAIRLAEWQAALTGITGRLPKPDGSGSAAAHVVAKSLFKHVETALASNGDMIMVEEGLRRVLEDGGGSRQQRAAYAKRSSLPDVMIRAVDVTHHTTRLTSVALGPR
jgi:carboxylate-amine ligase